MKNSLLLFSVLFILCFELAEAQPNLPDSSHVLVVYKIPISPQDTLGQISFNVKEYYKNARHIPESNILGLESLTNAWITDPGTQESHYIELRQQGEAIVDTFNVNT